MKHVVVDASVIVKWVVPETHSDAALNLLSGDTQLYVPGHWLAEVCTTLWAKSAIKGVLTQAQANARITWLSQDLVVHETDVRTLTLAASALAFDLHITVYDTLYLALAKQRDIPFVTADRKLYEKAKADRRFADRLLWVADLAVRA